MKQRCITEFLQEEKKFHPLTFTEYVQRLKKGCEHRWQVIGFNSDNKQCVEVTNYDLGSSVQLSILEMFITDKNVQHHDSDVEIQHFAADNFVKSMASFCPHVSVVTAKEIIRRHYFWSTQPHMLSNECMLNLTQHDIISSIKLFFHQ